MNSETPSEPPEEPLQRSEPALLSPASPKPLHFPQPTNIPILDMQHDVAFNQTEPHMADPAMRNTDVRPDFWRDPNEQQAEAADHASPYSTGAGEGSAELAEAATQQNGVQQQPESNEAGQFADSTDTAANGVSQPPPSNTPNEVSHQVNGQLPPTVAQESDQAAAFQPSLDPSIPSADPLAQLSGAQSQSYEVSTEQAQPSSASAYPGQVDMQALLGSLQVPNASSNVNAGDAAQPQPLAPGVEGTSLSASGLGAPANGLPARPPPQEQPLINPNYVHSQHIRDYHPHAAHPAFQPQHGRTGSQGNTADPTSHNYVPPVHTPSGTAPTAASGAGALFPQASPTSALPNPTPTSARGASANSTPIESRREYKIAAGEALSAEDRPWDASVQAKYDRFIESERGYVSEGRWEQFPPNSRLFVGNLSSEKVTKRDIFHIFHPYGELAQISIKQAYGFVQYLRAEDCRKALDAEQGAWIRDKRIHLEVSKPQKVRPGAQQQQQQQGRRSRSPDYGRGKQVDRYVSGNNRGYRQSSVRSPSPPRGSRQRYDDRPYRTRSPDYGRRGGYGRSPSPRRSEDDDLPLPRRAPQDIPDVQILVIDAGLEREFINWVQQGFSSRSVRVDVLIVSPRLNEQAVVRRQIVEGVLAVVKLRRPNQANGKLGITVFDRSSGSNNVKFNEYEGLDPGTCAALVLQAKTTARAPPTPSYGGGYGGQQPYAPPPLQHLGHDGYGQPPSAQYGQPPPAYPPTPAQYGQPQPPVGQPPNLQHLITSLDPNGLQNLLSAMNSGQTPATPMTGYGGTPQSAAPGYPPNAGYPQQQQQQTDGAPSGGQQGRGGSSSVNMQDILARLGTGYRQ